MESIRHSFMPVITLGLKDAFNPYALAIGVTFFIMLLFFGKDLMRTYLLGVMFLSVYIWTNFSVLLGGFDHIFALSGFTFVAEYAYLILATVLMIIGILLYLDEMNTEKNGPKTNRFIKIPAYSIIQEEKPAVKGRFRSINRIFSFVNALVFTVAFAFAFSLFQNLWNKDYYLSLMYYLLRLEMHHRFAVRSFFVYCIFYSALLIFGWLVAIYLLKRYSRLGNKGKAIVMVQKTLSVLSISVGLGLIILNFI